MSKQLPIRRPWGRLAVVVSLAIACTFHFASDAIAVPEPPPKAKKTEPKTPAVPDLETLLGESNWGTVTQRGREIEITGHPSWDAVGRVRDDGKVFLLWTLKSNGDPCPGVYEVKDGELQGLWGHSESVTIEADGSLTGAVRQDTVRNTKQIEPPVN